MRGLFAEKLQAQAADIAAAGLASLEDFLLHVEEKTSISWMAIPEGEKKTPSSGLPMTPPFGSRVLDDGPTPPRPPHPRDLRSAADTFDDGPTTKAPEEVMAAARALAPPPPAPPGRPARPKSGPQFPVPEQLATVRATTSPHNETAASAAPPPAPEPALAAPDQITLRPQLPAQAHDPRVASPTATTAGTNMPPPLAPMQTRISSEQAQLPPPYGAARATARHEAWIPPSRWRRVLVAGSAAVAVGAIALAVALWPSAEPAAQPSQPTPTQPTPSQPTPTQPTQPPSQSQPTPTTQSPAQPPGANTQATLIIDLDAPGDIAVDGKPQARGQSATVNVQPGVEHEVTVQRAGHAARRLHVPALSPGEHMPLRVKL
jgi:hypothetical protein